MLQKKRILICPLDWGLGHATRCIPIIELLLKKNAEVLIAGNGRSLSLLKIEFPSLTFIDLPGYDINYTEGSMILKMLFSSPRIFKGIKTEHKRLKKIISENKIDVVISDNRFGLWNKQIKTIFITHQLLIKSPIAERLLYRINRHYIRKFTECWIPDNEGKDNLSGELSHPYPIPLNAFYIGLLSRFIHNSSQTSLPVLELKKLYDVMVIISGPEPQRSIFEKLILNQAQHIPINFLVVRGITEDIPKLERKGNLDIVSHLSRDRMQNAILSSSLIISRSGYSTIMDLAVLKKKAIFIPTPGQTEQEYLAIRCMNKRVAYFQTQKKFNLKTALEECKKYDGFSDHNDSKLEERVDLILNDVVPTTEKAVYTTPV